MLSKLLSFMFITSASFAGQTTIQPETAVIEVPVQYVVKKMSVACVVEFVEDSEPYIYFKREDYGAERDLWEAGFKKKMLKQGQACNFDTSLTLAKVLPYSKAEVIEEEIEAAGGFQNVEVLFYKHTDSQSFNKRFYETMQKKIR